jgi:hypothetical protein
MTAIPVSASRLSAVSPETIRSRISATPDADRQVLKVRRPRVEQQR